MPKEELQGVALPIEPVVPALIHPNHASSLMLAKSAPLLAIVALALLSSKAPAQNGGRESLTEPPTAESDSWYGESTPQPAVTPRMIIQQKAQMRAYQRMARMESMKWYGMNASRPVSNATPFSGVPSPRWEMPGARSFSWYPPRTVRVIYR